MMIVIMEKFTVKKHQFSKFKDSRTGIVINFNGETIIGIVPPKGCTESFIMNEDGTTKIIDENEYEFEFPNEEAEIVLKIGVGLEIKSYKENKELEKIIFIPVKSNWSIDFRNRRVCGSTRIIGDEVYLNLKRK